MCQINTKFIIGADKFYAFYLSIIAITNFITELSDSTLAAQSYVFFTAGSDTTAMIISNLFYELAVNELIQDKLREEIDDQKLSYHGLKNMKYLDKVWKGELYI